MGWARARNFAVTFFIQLSNFGVALIMRSNNRAAATSCYGTLFVGFHTHTIR